jgi:hypothetical protein
MINTMTNEYVKNGGEYLRSMVDTVVDRYLLPCNDSCAE